MGLKTIQNFIAEDEQDQLLISLIQQGLPLTHRPYQGIAETMGLSEEEVINRIQRLKIDGIIKRFGVIVRHRELGYNANGMVVWNMPDEQVTDLGHCIGQFPCVTLSYRRPRRLPDWPYNLFTMVHGSNREQVLEYVQQIIDTCSLQDINYDVLFSTRCFKQRGACYSSATKVKQSGGSHRSIPQSAVKLTLLK